MGKSVERRHLRHGFVSGVHLRIPDDLNPSLNVHSDNDGLWTAMYLGSQAYHFTVTGDPAARNRARRSLEALMRLESITGVPGFYARSFVSKNESLPGSGEWHPTPDGQWHWKSDTSSDESVGHYYAYALYFDLVADDSEKAEIRKVVARMTDYLIQNDYDMLDLDGKPTRWGRWSERYYRTDEGQYEAALNSLELLSFLKTTHHITGDEKYYQAYLDRIERGYAHRMRNYRRWPGGGEINFGDDELAFLPYDPLLRYETDPELRAIYLDGLRFTWGEIRSDCNPLWYYIAVASGANWMTSAIRRESRRTLERIPMGLRQWQIKNSHRLDVAFRPDKERFGCFQLVRLPAPDERPMSKWNNNPYVPDGGNNGSEEEAGTLFLLPYWMGRHHGWVE